MENVYTILQQIYLGNCIKFHRKCPSFIEDIQTNNILVSLSGHSVYTKHGCLTNTYGPTHVAVTVTLRFFCSSGRLSNNK